MTEQIQGLFKPDWETLFLFSLLLSCPSVAFPMKLRGDKDDMLGVKHHYPENFNQQGIAGFPPPSVVTGQQCKVDLGYLLYVCAPHFSRVWGSRCVESNLSVILLICMGSLSFFFLIKSFMLILQWMQPFSLDFCPLQGPVSGIIPLL